MPMMVSGLMPKIQPPISRDHDGADADAARTEHAAPTAGTAVLHVVRSTVAFPPHGSLLNARMR